jgi:hypothetical protein
MNELRTLVDQQIPSFKVYFHTHDDGEDNIIAFN